MTQNEGFKKLQQHFQSSADIKFSTDLFNDQVVHFIICEKMVDTKLLHEVVIPRIQFFI